MKSKRVFVYVAAKVEYVEGKPVGIAWRASKASYEAASALLDEAPAFDPSRRFECQVFGPVPIGTSSYALLSGLRDRLWSGHGGRY